MSTQFSRPMFVNSFSLFAPWCEPSITDDSCLFPIGDNATEFSVGENTILSETGDASISESSDVPTLDSASVGHKSVTWSDFMITMDNDGSIHYERMPSKCGTANGLVGVP